MKSNNHIFYESLIHATAAALIARNPSQFKGFLGESKSSFLLEAYTNEEANKLSTALKAQKKITDDVNNALPKSMEKTKEILSQLSAQIDQVSNTKEIAVMAQKGDAKALKKKIEELNKIFTRVGNLTAAVVQTMINAAENLQPIVDEYKAEKGQNPEDIEELNLTMVNFSTDPSKKKEFGEIQKILKAVSDSFDVPDWQKSSLEKGSAAAQDDAGSAWGALKSFIGGLFGKAVEAVTVGGRKAFAEDLRIISINDIINAKPAMETAKQALTPVTEQSAEEVALATAGGAEVANPGVGQGAKSSPAAPDPAAASAAQERAVAAADEQSLGKTLAALAKTITDGIPLKTSDEAKIRAEREEIQASLTDQLKQFTTTAAGNAGKAITKSVEGWLKQLPKREGGLYDLRAITGYLEQTKPGEAIKKAVADNLKVEARRRRKQSMARLTEHQIVDRMHAAYHRRLHEVLGETDVRDSRGNVVIQPGLKVRHKKTQLEYTVDSVGEDRSGDLVIRLRNPEEPRFEPSYGQKFVGEEAPLLSARPDPMAPVGLEPLDDPGVDLEKGSDSGAEGEEEVEFVIDEKEFEKDYEVK